MGNRFIEVLKNAAEDQNYEHSLEDLVVMIIYSGGESNVREISGENITKVTDDYFEYIFNGATETANKDDIMAVVTKSQTSKF